MKKIFSLCAALLVAFAASAATININPGESVSGKIAAAEAGDVFILADGTYEEGNQILFYKNLTLQAAEGAHPIIAIRWYCEVGKGADVTIKGIKFDGKLYGEGLGASDHFLRAYNEANGTEKLTIEDCEFTGFPNYLIYFQKGTTRRIDALTIRNCYFHDNGRSAIYAGYDGGNSLNSVTIENSTFANFIWGTDKDDEAVIAIKNAGTETNDQVVRIDHCTFYNYKKNNSNGYTFLDVRKSTDVRISNCIFAQPATDMSGATYVYGGSIDNCLTFNCGHRSSTIVHNGIEGDPKFVHAAKGDYGLFKDSPAINAGSDSKTLGDPRWWPVKVAMKGAWDEWAKQLVFEDATDGLTATAKMHLDKNMEPGYEFKMLNGGEWCVNEGFWFTHDGNKKADNVVPQVGDGNPMVLKAYKGDYTFTWTYATKSLEVTFPSADTKYYLHGSFNEWVDIEMAENAGILSATAALEANVNDYRFKIKKVDFLENVTWYGAQDEINMMTKDNCTNWDLDDTGGFDIYITSDKKGDYKFSFNPADKKLSVIYPSGTGINNVEMGEKAVKVIENGQLYIIKNGVKINALGTVVK